MSDGSLHLRFANGSFTGAPEEAKFARGPSATPQPTAAAKASARAHAYVRTIRPPDIRGAAAQTLLMDVRTTAVSESTEQDEDGREKEGLLTVCRLNVLGPLLNQLTYCLCGRQPLPCLHGTFLSTPPPPPPPPPLPTPSSWWSRAYTRPCLSSYSFFTLPETADTFPCRSTNGRPGDSL